MGPAVLPGMASYRFLLACRGNARSLATLRCVRSQSECTRSSSPRATFRAGSRPRPHRGEGTPDGNFQSRRTLVVLAVVVARSSRWRPGFSFDDSYAHAPCRSALAIRQLKRVRQRESRIDAAGGEAFEFRHRGRTVRRGAHSAVGIGLSTTPAPTNRRSPS